MFITSTYIRILWPPPPSPFPWFYVINFHIKWQPLCGIVVLVIVYSAVKDVAEKIRVVLSVLQYIPCRLIRQVRILLFPVLCKQDTYHLYIYIYHPDIIMVLQMSAKSHCLFISSESHSRSSSLNPLCPPPHYHKHFLSAPFDPTACESRKGYYTIYNTHNLPLKHFRQIWETSI